MESAKCGNFLTCRKTLNANDTIYQVRYANRIGDVDYAPCCCRECANTLQQHYINMHRQRMQETENQSFQIMKLKDFE